MIETIDRTSVPSYPPSHIYILRSMDTDVFLYCLDWLMVFRFHWIKDESYRGQLAIGREIKRKNIIATLVD